MQLGLPFANVTASDDSTPTPGVVEPSEALIFVRHRKARRYVMRVCPDGRIRVTIPRGGSQREARGFVSRHGEWIARQRARLIRRAWPAEALAGHRARAETELPPRLLALAAQHGLNVTGVSIRNQRTRWGSCGHNGRISINWRLVLMPDWVSDYVLIHELMHLRRMDHSAEFWRLVADACPRYREARAWLRTNGPTLK